MSQTFEFYDTRAKEAAAEADKADLENVRDRCLRAEKTWRGLANQARKVMVDSQVRVNDVTDRAIQAAMLSVPRERFLPNTVEPVSE